MQNALVDGEGIRIICIQNNMITQKNGCNLGACGTYNILLQLGLQNGGRILIWNLQNVKEFCICDKHLYRDNDMVAPHCLAWSSNSNILVSGECDAYLFFIC